MIKCLLYRLFCMYRSNHVLRHGHAAARSGNKNKIREQLLTYKSNRAGCGASYAQ